MDRREKVKKLLNALGLIDKVRIEINWFRNPMSMMDHPFARNAPNMLEIDENEEAKIIDAFVDAHCEYLKDNSDEELSAVITYYESGIGKKILNPSRDFLKQIGDLVPRTLLPKMRKYSDEKEAQWEREMLPDKKLN